MFLGNPKDSVWKDWGNLRDLGGNWFHPPLKNPIQNGSDSLAPVISFHLETHHDFCVSLDFQIPAEVWSFG